MDAMPPLPSAFFIPCLCHTPLSVLGTPLWSSKLRNLSEWAFDFAGGLDWQCDYHMGACKEWGLSGFSLNLLMLMLVKFHRISVLERHWIRTQVLYTRLVNLSHLNSALIMLEEPGGASHKEKEYIPPGKQHMQDITGIPTCFS